MTEPRLWSSSKPILPQVVGCFLLFNAMSVLLTMYRVYYQAHSTHVSMIPQSRLRDTEQWLWLLATAIGQVVCGCALLRRWPRARQLLEGVTVSIVGVNFATSDMPLAMMIWMCATASVPMGMLMLSRGEIAFAMQERRHAPTMLRRVIGRVLFGLAASVLFVVLTSLFNGATPAHATNTEAGVGTFVMIALSFMIVGGAVYGEAVAATREIGLVLVSLASYLIFFCIWTYVTCRLVFPGKVGHFFWDDTLLWIVILGIGGFVLLARSEYERANGDRGR